MSKHEEAPKSEASRSPTCSAADYEERLRAKYSCTASDNDGWCNGVAVGSRLRCPEVLVCKDKSRACNLGFQKGLDEQMCM